MVMTGYLYPARAGETWDSIALDLYGDEKYAAELIYANRELPQQLVFLGGEMLKIPAIEIPEEGAPPVQAPWRG